MHLPDPTFPPLLSGHGVSAPGRVLPVACDGAERGAFEAGHVIWARNTAIAEFAFVFEPEVDREQAQDMRIVLQTAIADGLGAIMPSQTAIQFGWPDDIIVNGAKVGETCLVVSSRETDAVPAWLVTGVRLVLTRDLEGLEPALSEMRVRLPKRTVPISIDRGSYRRWRHICSTRCRSGARWAPGRLPTAGSGGSSATTAAPSFETWPVFQ
jgi:BirA family biotin operon repressor/biotin-[acetyl-CoA-carboxylase] ligase